MYDGSPDGIAGHFPFIVVPEDKEMPSVLYIFESRETGETEKATDGEVHPVMQLEMHQYADMSVLKRNLDEDLFDRVRAVLGLESLRSASEKGEKILNQSKNLSDNG